MKLPSRRRTFLCAVAATCAVVWVSTIALPHRAGRSSFLDQIETVLVHLRLSTIGAIRPPGNVAIIAIDNAALAAESPLGQGRQVLADIVDGIAAAGAPVIAVDILLTDKGSPAGDRALAAALAKLPSVIAAAGNFSAGPAEQAVPATRDELWPQPAFTDVSDVGLVNVSTDHSGTPLHVPMVFMTSRGPQPSMAAQTAALFAGEALSISAGALRLGERVIPLDTGLQMPLRLAGPTGTIPTIPAMDLLQGPALIDLSGKAVILGVTATGLGERFSTPFDPDLPGVEVMATAVSQLIGGDLLRRDDTVRRIDVAAALVLAILCTVATLMLPLSVGIPLAMGTLALWTGIVWLAFAFGIWLSAALPLASVFPPLALAAIFRYMHERRKADRADRAVSALKKFQSPALSQRIAEDPDFLSAPESRELVVSFADLSGFTQISQDLGPERSEAFLKKFHTILEQIVETRGGIVLNLMGDGALLVFGMLDQSANPADNALQAAIAIAKQTRALGKAEGFARPLGARIGLHWGSVVLSRMGSDRQQQLTITGDTVNLCNRLLEIIKAESATIAATGEFVSQASRPLPVPADRRATYPVRGRNGEVDLHFWLL